MKSSKTTGTSAPRALEGKKTNRENAIAPECHAKKEKLVNSAFLALKKASFSIELHIFVLVIQTPPPPNIYFLDTDLTLTPFYIWYTLT